MSLHDDLRKQAWHLARREPRKPTQASLRRAISAAYFALFHLLIDEATGTMFGRGRQQRGFRHVLARGFTHESMVAACKSFGGGTLPQQVRNTSGLNRIPGDLQYVAETFVTLQDERHRADYNLAAPFQRSEVLALLAQLDMAFEAWSRIRNEDASRLFLMSLPLWKQLQR
jgi:uncharacterized protein (UPF0332 family)